MILTSTSVPPLVHDVVAGSEFVGFAVGWVEVGMELVGWSVLVGLDVGWREVGVKVGWVEVGMEVVGWLELVGLDVGWIEVGVNVGWSEVGVRVGRFDNDGLKDGRSVTALDGRELGGLVADLKKNVSDHKNAPPECTLRPSTRISYLPSPDDPQHIPSPHESVIVNLYAKQLGRQTLVECMVEGSVYCGLLMVAPAPHL